MTRNDGVANVVKKANRGNPNPETSGDNGGEYGTTECPFCEGEFKKLPSHLPECPDT